MPLVLDLPRLLCRPALPMDTPQVLAFTRKIWEGEDYIPDIWEEWLTDSEGLLAVAEYGGRVIGLSKLTRLDADQWWLEGLRVHPEYQGQGVAAHLHDYQLDYWHRRGSGVIRLATVSSREPVKHLAVRSGFKPVAEYTRFRSSSDLDHQSYGESFTQVDPTALDALYEHMASAPALTLQFGLVNLGWQWARPTPENLARLLHERRAWWWRERVGIVIASEETEKTRTYFSIRTIACRKEEIVMFLNEIRGLAARLGHHTIYWLAPLHSDLLPMLSEAGFDRDWDEALVIFEKSHNG